MEGVPQRHPSLVDLIVCVWTLLPGTYATRELLTVQNNNDNNIKNKIVKGLIYSDINNSPSK